MERQHIKNALYQQAIGGSGAEFAANESEFFLRLLASGFSMSAGGIITLTQPPVFSAASLTNIPAPTSIGGLSLATLVAGDLLIATGASALARLADVAAGQILASGGVGVAPAWSASPAFSGANVTALNAAQLTTGLIPDARIPGFTSDGVSRIQQLAFAATQSASADANTLDDYEEGLWTPVIGGSGGTSGQTYTMQVGTYVKWGRAVYAQFKALLSAKGTITGSAQINGLPFATDGTANVEFVTALGWNTLATTWVNVSAAGFASVSALSLIGATVAAAGNFTGLATGDIGNTTALWGAICYRAAA